MSAKLPIFLSIKRASTQRDFSKSRCFLCYYVENYHTHQSLSQIFKIYFFAEFISLFPLFQQTVIEDTYKISNNLTKNKYFQKMRQTFIKKASFELLWKFGRQKLKSRLVGARQSSRNRENQMLSFYRSVIFTNEIMLNKVINGIK